MNIKSKSVKELETLCEDIRQEILRVVSKNGSIKPIDAIRDE